MSRFLSFAHAGIHRAPHLRFPQHFRPHFRAMASLTTATDNGVTKLQYLLILDFEATCGDAIQGKNEIIEFPTLLYSLEKDEVEATFHEYVRPVIYPRLTEFCTELTGITQVRLTSILRCPPRYTVSRTCPSAQHVSFVLQETVDKADAFPEVWTRYQEFLKTHNLIADPESCVFLTCGNWDLNAMLPSQLASSELDTGAGPAVPLPFDRWINVKSSYQSHYKARRAVGMAGMLRELKIPLEGRHHSGIDDCRNILSIVRRMRADGWTPWLDRQLVHGHN